LPKSVINFVLSFLVSSKLCESLTSFFTQTPVFYTAVQAFSHATSKSYKMLVTTHSESMTSFRTPVLHFVANAQKRCQFQCRFTVIQEQLKQRCNSFTGWVHPGNSELIRATSTAQSHRTWHTASTGTSWEGWPTVRMCWWRAQN